MTAFRLTVTRLAPGMVLTLFVAAISGAHAAQPASQPSASDWVKKLGDDQWKVRDEAQRQLIALGEQARPAVLVALTSPDPEVRLRARAIWARIIVPARFTCSGHVSDASGAPAAGAEMVAYHWWSDPAKGQALELIGTCAADGKGRFAFNHPLKDGYPMGFIAARAPGWAVAWTDWESKDDSAIALTLQKPLAMGGTVVDDKGGPVAGASVRAQLLLPAADGARILDSLPQCDWFAAKTDERGRFRFDNVPAETRAALLVQAPGHGCVNQRDPVWGWLAEGPASAGKTDLRVVLPPEAAIEGKIVDRATGNPIAGLAVNVGSLQPPAVSAADGTFRIGGLVAGKFTISLVTPLGETGDWVAAPAEVKLETGQTSKGVTLEAVKGGLVEAVITDANDGRPIEGANFLVFPDAGDKGELSQAGWRPCYSGRSNREGLAMMRLPPGEHRLLAAAKSGEYYTWDLQPAKVLKIEDGKRQRVEISLRPLHRISGQVLDESGKPVAGAWVMGISTVGAGVTNAAGRFDFGWQPCGPAPMALRLLVRHPNRNLCAVVAVPDPEAQIEVRLAPGVRVTGLVTDPAGKPLARASVRAGIVLDDGYVGAGRRDVLTDDTGRYEWRALPRGKIRLQGIARARGQGSAEVKVEEVKPNAVEVPDIVLPPADLSVSGVVKDRAGKPVEGVTVWLQGEGQPSMQAQPTTDPQGKFRIEGVCKGRVLLCAHEVRSGRSYNRSIQVTGQDIEINLENAVDEPAGRD